jgi:hypothetical protein
VGRDRSVSSPLLRFSPAASDAPSVAILRFSLHWRGYAVRALAKPFDGGFATADGLKRVVAGLAFLLPNYEIEFWGT